MKESHLRRAAFLAVAALPVLDFVLLRAFVFREPDENSDLRNLFLILGGLPFANILVLGLPVSLYSRRHGFVRGFEAVGALSLALFGVDYVYAFPFFCDTYMCGVGGPLVFHSPKMWIPYLLVIHSAFAISGGLFFVFADWFVRELRQQRGG